MEKKKKIILAVCIAVLLVAISIPAFIVGTFIVSEVSQNAERVEIQGVAIAKCEKYLKDKYSEKTFTIVEAEVDELYNGFTHGGWSDVVKITVKDSDTNKTYNVIVDTKTDGDCRDDVQSEMIENAIIAEVCKIAGLNADDCKISIDHVNKYYEKKYNGKYTGNIIEFLQSEREDNDNWHLRIHVSYVDKLENFVVDEDAEEFIDLCDTLVYINFAEKIPTRHYTYDAPESVARSLVEGNIKVKHVWSFNGADTRFVDYLESIMINV